MYAQNHTTEPADSGTWHYWEISGPRGSVSLSALHCHDRGIVELTTAVPSIAAKVSITATGAWVFDVLQSHRHNPGSGWSCPRHGDDCDMDAFVSQIAEPKWVRIREADFTDEAVFAELQPLFAVEFGQVAL